MLYLITQKWKLEEKAPVLINTVDMMEFQNEFGKACRNDDLIKLSSVNWNLLIPLCIRNSSNSMVV